MGTTIFLIRHGKTEGSNVKRYLGSTDVPMSENGIEQIKRISSFISAEVLKRRSELITPEHRNLQALAVTAVYCSPLSRALKSAGIIAEAHNLKPAVIDDLRERSFGIWEGMTFMEIKEKYPDEFEAWANNPLKYSPMGGESTIEVRDRAIKALDTILDNHRLNSEENIVIVAHGGVNRVILCHMLGMPLENIFRIEQDNAAVNIIEFWDKYPVVKLINGGPVG
ncbi:MAG: histidine phosphatase family protein [Thermodesulfovibrio sp.]|nr:histidine phosphatase family protein [Thermodesulfovibrio sp.]